MALGFVLKLLLFQRGVFVTGVEGFALVDHDSAVLYIIFYFCLHSSHWEYCLRPTLGIDEFSSTVGKADVPPVIGVNPDIN